MCGKTIDRHKHITLQTKSRLATNERRKKK